VIGGSSVFFQAEDGIRVFHVTGVQTCALPILAELAGRLVRSLEKLLNRKRERLQALKNRPAFRHPRVRLEQQNQRLDQLAWDLHRSFRARLDWKRSELEHLVSRLAARRPAERISALRERR